MRCARPGAPGHHPDVGPVRRCATAGVLPCPQRRHRTPESPGATPVLPLVLPDAATLICPVKAPALRPSVSGLCWSLTRHFLSVAPVTSQPPGGLFLWNWLQCPRPSRGPSPPEAQPPGHYCATASPSSRSPQRAWRLVSCRSLLSFRRGRVTSADFHTPWDQHVFEWLLSNETVSRYPQPRVLGNLLGRPKNRYSAVPSNGKPWEKKGLTLKRFINDKYCYLFFYLSQWLRY